MLTKDDILKKLKELKSFLSNEFSVKKIGLFGSYSDNLQNEESDIDILVEFKKPIGWKFFSLEKYLEDIFKRKVDLVTKKALKKQLKDRILNQTLFLSRNQEEHLDIFLKIFLSQYQKF
ncbi:MAG: nucleotidyltransferase family protein [Bacteroidota bacterium]|nr:nucleotidyltransferase family protein [Bacteroidota bacterium]